MDFIIGIVGSRPIEIVAFICGLINVILIIRRSIWNYPFGFIMVSLYAIIFYEYQLYSDSLLQIYYFFIQIYGVINWLQGRKDDGTIKIESMPAPIFFKYLSITAILWIFVSYLMGAYTNAAYPYWDGAIAALSVLAQLLLSRRIMQNWYLWIMVDLLAIGLFYTEGLYPTAVLYVIFLGLAITGLVSWKKQSAQRGAI